MPLDKLNEFIARLDRLPIEKVGRSGVLKMQSGQDSHGVSLFSAQDASIVLWRIEPESESIMHIHDATEWIIVYNGSLEISANVEDSKIIGNVDKVNEMYILNAGDFVYIPPQIRHRVSSAVGADMIVIAIPRAEEFPR